MGILNELFGGLGKGVAAEPRLTIADGVSEGVCRSVWARYVAYRQAGYLTPFSVRKTPYKQKIFSMGTHIIKEYTGARETVEKEVGILQQLHHPHLVSFMFIADQGSRISIVMDWAGENLREHRTVTQSQQYTEDVARYMMYQLTSALVYLHNKGIIHRDIKPDNIAVQRDHTVQLFDWGEALSLQQIGALSDRELAKQAGVAGTPLFMPPEVLNYLTDRDSPGEHALRRIISTKLDIWGLGAVLFFLLAGRDIFVADSEWELDSLADIASASTGVELPEGVEASYAARDFLRCCLQRDPSRRSSAQELSEHPWLFGAHSFADMAAAAEAAAAAAVAAALEAETDQEADKQQAAAAFQQWQGGLGGSLVAPTGRSLMAQRAQLSVLAESCSFSEGDEGAAMLSADPLTASLALASGVAGLGLGPPSSAAAHHMSAHSSPASAGPLSPQQQQQLLLHSGSAAGSGQQAQQQQQPPRRLGSHHRMESYGSCKSLVALEDDHGLAAAQLQRAADGEAVCEVRLRLSPSTASIGSLVVTSAA